MKRITRYWIHRKYKDFKQKTVEVANWKNELKPLGVVQYISEDEPHYVSPRKHGNATGVKHFYPTSHSTKNITIKRVCLWQGPPKFYNQTFQDGGGMFAVKAVSDLPRNTRQVKYERSKLRQKGCQSFRLQVVSPTRSESIRLHLQVDIFCEDG